MRVLIAILMALVLFCGCSTTTERLSAYEVQGIDVSHYQKVIDWKSVEADQIDFAYIKATEGEIHQDTNFCRNWMDIKNTKIRRGAYHFFRPKLSALQQANNFLFAIEKLENGDLPPVLDIEVTDGASKEIVINRMKSWLEIIEIRLHQKPIIYTNLKFYFQFLIGNFDDYNIWISRYNDAAPQLVAKQWTFWQYGRQGRVQGIEGEVDLNVFYGNHAQLDSLRFPSGFLSKSEPKLLNNSLSNP